MTKLIRLSTGEVLTSEQFRAANPGVFFAGDFPSAAYLAHIGASLVEAPVPPPTDADVNAERTRRLEYGSEFTVAGVANPIPLTGRDFDQSVYLALLLRAQGYKAAGVTAPILTLRDRSDVTHNLTPDQMISLITQSMTWFESVMATSWDMKDNGIPVDYADDKHWPL